MSSFFQNLIARIKGTHSVDAVLASYHKTIAKLEAVRDAHVVKAYVHKEQSALLGKIADLADKEADRAHALATKMREHITAE